MTLGRDELDWLADRASAAARRAGNLIASARPTTISDKIAGGSPASRVVTDIDRSSQELIVGELEPTIQRFDLGLLSEERQDDGLRLEKEYFWCIDPLDGTLGFVNGEPGYAVSIALVSRAGEPVIGVVVDPVDGVLYCAKRGCGVTRNERQWTTASARAGRRLSAFFDRSFLVSDVYDATVTALRDRARALGLDAVDIRSAPGAVMNACRALEGHPACYFKLPKSQQGGGSVWDFAATACLFTEAGAIATDIHGLPLDLNRPDSTFMNHRGVLFATDARIAAQLRALGRELTRA